MRVVRARVVHHGDRIWQWSMVTTIDELNDMNTSWIFEGCPSDHSACLLSMFIKSICSTIIMIIREDH